VLHVFVGDAMFSAVHDKLETLLDPALFIGRAPQQVADFIDQEVKPILEEYAELTRTTTVDLISV
jgi:adenylosuccinate lyase